LMIQRHSEKKFPLTKLQKNYLIRGHSSQWDERKKKNSSGLCTIKYINDWSVIMIYAT
jgi:hypothetical protein